MNHIDIRPGVRIAYRDDCFVRPWQSSETVLMIHGIAESGQAWITWVPVLAARFRVIRIDLPGFGASTAPRGYDWRPANLAADICGFLDRLGLEKVHVVGAKYGGTIALSLGIHFASRVLSLGVFSAPVAVPAINRKYGRTTLELIREDRCAWIERTMPSRLGSGVSRAQMDWWIELMAQADPRVFLDAMEVVEKLSLADSLHRITAPTLIATTQGSGLQSVGAVEEYTGKIPNSELLVMPGDSFHIAAAEPERCALHYLSFLDRRCVVAEDHRADPATVPGFVAPG
jgi:3-oxoadipate enol-lactonase